MALPECERNRNRRRVAFGVSRQRAFARRWHGGIQHPGLLGPYRERLGVTYQINVTNLFDDRTINILKINTDTATGLPYIVQMVRVDPRNATAANVIDSGIWDDLSGPEETRHIVKNTPKPENGPIEIYSDFSANLVVSATPDQPLIVAKRRVRKTNPHHPARTRSEEHTSELQSPCNLVC